MSFPTAAPSRHILLVEGRDDAQVVRQICKRYQSAPDFCLLEKRNVTSLLDSIALTIKDMRTAETEDQALGILVDANACLSARWAELRVRLEEVGVALADSPDPDGTVIDGDIRIGLWLMPTNTSDGELEGFVSRMIPGGDPVWLRACHYIDGISEADRKFAADKAAKARLYAWLAARKEPRLMGWAIRDEDLEVDGDLCQRFVAWLTRLFG